MLGWGGIGWKGLESKGKGGDVGLCTLRMHAFSERPSERTLVVWWIREAGGDGGEARAVGREIWRKVGACGHGSYDGQVG